MKNSVLKPVEKSTLKNVYALFFDLESKSFVVKKSGIKNNSLKPLMIYTGNSEWLAYSDSNEENLKLALENVAQQLNEEVVGNDKVAETVIKHINEGKDIILSSEKKKPEQKSKGGEQKGKLTPLETEVLKACITHGDNGSGVYVGFSFRVCEGNLSYAGAFSTLQRKGYIETFVDTIDKRKEKCYKILLNIDGKPV